MTVKAKPILKDKFWIIEQNNEKLGTLSKTDDHFLFTCNEGVQLFDTAKQLDRKFGKIIWSVADEKVASTDCLIYGFPTKSIPMNGIFDIKRKLPLFTKTETSKSLYAAGYYIIKFPKGWIKGFCPKLSTLDAYEFRGPFKTDIEAKLEMKNANN